MLFNSGEFAVFLIVVLLLDMILRNRLQPRYAFLLAASYFFYSCWNANYLLLLIFSTVLDFTLGRLIHLEQRKSLRKLYLLLSLSGNLGVLGVFKYGNFFIDNITETLPFLGDIPRLEVLLPVGISFYTFQTLSYTIDIYRRKLEPHDSFLGFALFVSFFPQLVAGPIVRASQFLPQLGKMPVITSADASHGFFLIARGLFKKVIIADYLAIHIVDQVFSAPGAYGSPTILIAVYAYAFQIYGDFSGYSDIAIGCGRLLGFKLPKNFDSPYVATDLRDFWRRWHISLSSWLRDYLYIPLGGSKRGQRATYINLTLTMLLGGLWHGAGWTFILWGLFHGVILAVTRMAQRAGAGSCARDPSKTGRVLRALANFQVVCLGWILFRSPDFETFVSMLAGLGGANGWALDVEPFVIVVLLVAAATHMMPNRFNHNLALLWNKLPAPAMAAALIVLIGVCSFICAAARPFIYFQF